MIVNSFDDKMSFQFLDGVEYMIIVHLEQKNGEVTSAKSLTVTTLPPDQALRVTVSGPTMVMADHPNSYQAKVTTCSDTIVKKDTKYKVSVVMYFQSGRSVHHSSPHS